MRVLESNLCNVTASVMKVSSKNDDRETVLAQIAAVEVRVQI